MSLHLALSVLLSQVDPTTVPPAPGPDDHPPVAAHAAAPQKSVTVAPVPVETKTAEAPWWQRVSIGGFARVGVFYNFPFKDEALVGGNGGFRVADFRLGAEFKPVDRFLANVSVELAAPLVDANDPLAGRRVVELRDAYVEYVISDPFVIRAGQMRPQYYAEMLLPDGAIPFVSRSVLAGGFSPPEAYGPRQPLAWDRQIGVQLGSRRLGSKNVGFKYAVGLFNGNGQNQLFNDNNSPAPFARAELELFEHVTLGLNGAFNVVSSGVRPNRLYTSYLSYGADVVAHVGGLSGMVGFLGKNAQYSFSGLTPDNLLGVMAQARYLHDATGLEFAARGAFYEPSTAQLDDQVIEIAAMVGWRPFKLPFRVLVQYTVRREEKAVEFMNDSIDAMLHAVW